MSVCSQLGLSHAGHFLGWQLKNWILINMRRHPALYVRIGADLEVVKWVRNGYELKLKRWPQDNVTKNSRWEMVTKDPHFV